MTSRACLEAMRWTKLVSEALWQPRRWSAIRRAEPREPIGDLTRFEQRVYSQNGEDGIVEAIFDRVGTTNRYCVEFGVGDGRECNTRRLLEQGWSGLSMDASEPPTDAPVPIRREFVNAENVNSLFRKYEVPAIFDLLSIDIDGNDYWVWKALDAARARVVVIEYNASVSVTESRSIAYDADFRWGHTDYFGASLLALQRLGECKSYTLVACDSTGVNAFFVDAELARRHFAPPALADVYRPPAYGGGAGHPRDPHRVMITVEPPEPAR